MMLHRATLLEEEVRKLQPHPRFATTSSINQILFHTKLDNVVHNNYALSFEINEVFKIPIS